MLKWTVKKRFADEAQLNNVRRTHSRRSLGNVLDENTAQSMKYHKRRSLGCHLNSEKVKTDKENHFVTPVRRKPNRESSTPLSDCSNLRRESHGKRKHKVISSSPMISPISMNIFVEPSTAIFPSSYAPTLPTFDVEYSPVMKGTPRFIGAECDEIPTKRLKMDLMDLSYEFQPESKSTSSPLSTPLVSRKFSNDHKITLNLSNDSGSMNSSEVGDSTLQMMIDDILASARTGKKFKKYFPQAVANNRDKNANFMQPLSEVCENMEQKSIEKLLSPGKIAQAADKTIIIADDAANNEREVKSPVTKKYVEISDVKIDETCQLKRQNAVRRKNTGSNENKNKKKPDDGQKIEKEFHDSSIQKCLSFSSANFDDMSDKFKRSSVASNSSSSSNSYVSQSKYTKNLLMKGSLEMAVSTEENQRKLVIHVIKCKNLIKLTEMPQINAYVKCALVSLTAPNGLQNVYQRTAVHKKSLEPIFDHKFTFELDQKQDHEKYLQLAVWHRNRSLKRSEFIGCLSFPVKNVLENNISGTFQLQPQSSFTKPLQLIPDTEGKTTKAEEKLPKFETKSSEYVKRLSNLEENLPKVDENLSKIEETFLHLQNGKDENELLQYLELNDIESCNNSSGRTPFTLTKTIFKQADNTFGFEISWTKPPKINSIRSHLDNNDLRKGDFIIFVGEINIVTMPKDEIISLIRKEDENLTLEIFRPIAKINSKDLIDRLAAQNTPIVSDSNKTPVTNELIETPKSRKSFLFKQPKICFQPTIGSGVIV